MEKPTDARQFGICLADVKERRIVWRSTGRLARGKMTDLSGDPGQGKTMMALDWCARISRGDPLPDGEPSDERGVIYITIEDDIEDTLAPRLRIAGADLRYCTVLKTNPDTGGFVKFPECVEILEQMVVAYNAAIIVIDPLTGFLMPGMSSNSNENIREAYQPVVDMAAATGVSILSLRHMNKQSSNSNAMYRGQGSIGVTAIARAGLTVARSQKNPEQRVLAQNKENLSKRMPSLAFELEPVPGEDHPRIRWVGETDEGADELLMDLDTRTEINDALEWLRDMLATGRQPAQDIEKVRRQSQISDRALRAAKKKLNVSSHREGYGPGSTVYWELPKMPVALSTNGYHHQELSNGDVEF